MATTGPETSSMAFRVASFGGHPFLYMVLHGLHNHDGVIHHEADGEDEAEEGEGC